MRREILDLLPVADRGEYRFRQYYEEDEAEKAIGWMQAGSLSYQPDIETSGEESQAAGNHSPNRDLVVELAFTAG